MNRTVHLTFVSLLCLLSLLACKSDYEKVRESGDSERTLALADELYEKGDYLRSNTLYELVLSNYRGKQQAERMAFRYANTHYEMQRYVTAAHYFEQFAQTYAHSDYKEQADFLIAKSYDALSPSFRLDQSYTHKAIEAYQRYINFHPTSEEVSISNDRIDALRQKLEHKAFDSAQLYYKMGEYQAALHSFENVLKDYPDTKDAELIRYLAVKASYDLAMNSYYDLKQERFEQVIKRYDLFVKRHPSSQYIPELNVIKDKSLKELKSLNDV